MKLLFIWYSYLLIYTDKDLEVPGEWGETGAQFIDNSIEVRLKSFSTLIHKVDTMVCYKDSIDETPVECICNNNNTDQVNKILTSSFNISSSQDGKVTNHSLFKDKTLLIHKLLKFLLMILVNMLDITSEK